MLLRYLDHASKEARIDCLFSLVTISEICGNQEDSFKEFTNHMISLAPEKKLMNIITLSDDHSEQIQALRVIGNLIYSDDNQTDVFMNEGLLLMIDNTMTSPESIL